MAKSTVVVAYEELLRQGWLKNQSSDLAKALDILEKHGLITAAEHKYLLDLAKHLGYLAS